MKIAVFYGESGDSEIDMSNPYKGNPGIGGIDFRLWMMPYYLQKKYRDVEVISYLVEKRNYPDALHPIVVKDIYEALALAQKSDADIFLCRNLQTSLVYHYMNRCKINIVLTAGNFISTEEQKYIANCKAIKKVVCVGKQQYQMLCDTSIYAKCTYIYNSIDCRLYKKGTENAKKENIVAYLGGIYPTKGFHILAKNWKYIKRAVPDAQLYVIGSGKLYSKNKKMGAYGIAEEEYERRFIRYLLDENGNILPDIHFWGTLGGNKKIEVMQRCKVGIVNPSGETETFCYSAIEFEALGVPVVTKAANGLYDTVRHRRTGILFSNVGEMVNATITLLRNEKVGNQLGYNAQRFVRTNFDIRRKIDEWYNLFYALCKGSYTYNDKESEVFSRHNLIWLRRWNAKLKEKEAFKNLPSIGSLLYRKYY